MSHKAMAPLVHKESTIDAPVALSAQSPNAVTTESAFGATIEPFRCEQMSVRVVQLPPTTCATSVDATYIFRYLNIDTYTRM